MNSSHQSRSSDSAVVSDQCSICLGQPHNEIVTSCGHRFCHMCLKSHLTMTSRRCPLCQTLIGRTEIQKHLKNPVCIDVTFPDREYIWMYSAHRNGWWIFEDRAQIELEKVWINYNESRSSTQYDLQIGGYQIKVDLQQMIQTIERTKSQRDIVRILRNDLHNYSIRGISGISVPVNDHQI